MIKPPTSDTADTCRDWLKACLVRVTFRRADLVNQGRLGREKDCATKRIKGSNVLVYMKLDVSTSTFADSYNRHWSGHRWTRRQGDGGLEVSWFRVAEVGGNWQRGR